MGQNEGEVAAPKQQNNVERLNEILGHNQMVNLETRSRLLADANAGAAPSGIGERIVQTTVDGIKKAPQALMHSFDTEHVMPHLTNLGIGAGIGVATKVLLPEAGPVAKVAGAALATWFIGKPVAESYGIALRAETKADMERASDHLGQTIGDMPVAIIEGGIGAKIGTSLTGRVLATEMAQPFVNWKAAKYDALAGHVDAAGAGARNIAFEQFGIGGPVMRANGRTGIVPPHMLEDLARNTKNPAFLETIRKTEQLANLNARRAIGSQAAVKTDFKGAREVYDAKGQEVVGDLARSEGQPATGNAVVDTSYEFTGNVRDFYRDVHGRNSIDNQGMKMKSTVNYGDMENAYWDGQSMTYGRPSAESPFKTFVLRDVTGHEITHGVTEFESGLVYRNQPGALNEHLSDVFGALVEQRASGQSAAQASWLVGEGIWKPGVKGRALRDMRNPGTAYDDPAVGKDPQPAHMKDFVRTRSDNGGVHLNSGIPNRAFVLFSDAVGGNAYDVPGKIWYEARKNAGSSPSFAQFAYETVEAAKKLGYTDAVAKLQKAWNDVGIKPSKTDTGATDPTILVGTIPDNDALIKQRFR